MKKFIFILIIFVQIGCTRSIYVPVESTRTEYRDNFLRDSIHIHDSIFVHMKQDTVWMEKFRTVYRDRMIRDSVFLRDTIQVPYPVEKIVYKTKKASFTHVLYILSFLLLLSLFYKYFFK